MERYRSRRLRHACTSRFTNGASTIAKSTKASGDDELFVYQQNLPRDINIFYEKSRRIPKSSLYRGQDLNDAFLSKSRLKRRNRPAMVSKLVAKMGYPKANNEDLFTNRRAGWNASRIVILKANPKKLWSSCTGDTEMQAVSLSFRSKSHETRRTLSKMWRNIKGYSADTTNGLGYVGDDSSDDFCDYDSPITLHLAMDSTTYRQNSNKSHCPANNEDGRNRKCGTWKIIRNMRNTGATLASFQSDVSSLSEPQLSETEHETESERSHSSTGDIPECFETLSAKLKELRVQLDALKHEAVSDAKRKIEIPNEFEHEAVAGTKRENEMEQPAENDIEETVSGTDCSDAKMLASVNSHAIEREDDEYPITYWCKKLGVKSKMHLETDITLIGAGVEKMVTDELISELCRWQ